MLKQEKLNFASENYAGVHEKIMTALTAANTGWALSYGNDQYTQETINLFKTNFGDNIEVYFTFNGTGANNFGIASVVDRHHCIFCTDVAHLNVDESTAPEAFTGCRIYPVKSVNGKLVPDDLRSKLKRVNDVHHPQPKIVTLTQPTEYGTVYTLEELREIKQICTETHMLLHVDGARFFNAAVYLNATLKQMSVDAGVDILTLGGTKSGLMFGEAVIFFNPASPNAFKFNLKRSMQLASKQRFIAAQFTALLSGDLWKEIAAHTNELAAKFINLLPELPGIAISQPVETNAVFFTMPESVYQKTQEFASFYCWNEIKNEYRLMFSFDSTMEEINEFIGKLSEAVE